MISVLILAKNEEVNIAACIDAVSWSDDIVVLDDGSVDRTTEIAEQKGARVVKHSAGNERLQREYSLRQIDFKHPWIYNPDADEVTPADLRDEMLAIVADGSRPEVAYRVRFKNMFMGSWIRHSSLYPTWVMRLFKPGKIEFERDINLTYRADGPVGRLQAHFLHYSFSKGIGEWIEKHNRYSTFEARELLKDLDSGSLDFGGLLALGDPVRRRRALKQLSFRLPFRPTLRFWYMYALRLGVLDGAPGLAYCRLLATYEYMIDLKVRELRRQREGKPV